MGLMTQIIEEMGTEPVSAENVGDLPWSKLVSGIAASSYGLIQLFQQTCQTEMSEEEEAGVLEKLETIRDEMSLMMEELDRRASRIENHVHGSHARPSPRFK